MIESIKQKVLVVRPFWLIIMKNDETHHKKGDEPVILKESACESEGSGGDFLATKYLKRRTPDTLLHLLKRGREVEKLTSIQIMNMNNHLHHDHDPHQHHPYRYGRNPAAGLSFATHLIMMIRSFRLFAAAPECRARIYSRDPPSVLLITSWELSKE